MPPLPFAPPFMNLNATSRTKSPYSFSLISQVPTQRPDFDLPPHRLPSLTTQVTDSFGGGLETSDQWPTIQPEPTGPSTGNSVAKGGSAAWAAANGTRRTEATTHRASTLTPSPPDW